VAYKYLPILSEMFPDAKTTLNQDIIANINDEFYASYDWFTIKEETTRGLGICDKDIDVRVNHLIDSTIGTNLGDDFKKISFNGIKNVQMGDYFLIDGNNYFIVINTETIKSPTSTCSVRRCNNTLRWMNSDGAIYSYPCVVDYKIMGSKDLRSRSESLPLIQGSIIITTQHNAITSTIQPNQRFLFGNINNWVAYRVSGGGVGNYQNLQTITNTSYGKLELLMEASFEDDQNDDVTNGIANVDKNVYVITVAPTAFSGVATDTITLVPTITLNGEVVTRTVTWTVTWTSGNLANTTVNATTGLVTLVKTGVSTIRCALANNATVYKNVVITVAGTTPAPTYSVSISPTTNYILLNGETTYTVHLFTNGVSGAETFIFTVDATSTAPTSKYVFTSLTGNTFKVKNLAMSLGAPLIISAVSVTTPTHTQLFTILLKGVY